MPLYRNFRRKHGGIAEQIKKFLCQQKLPLLSAEPRGGLDNGQLFMLREDSFWFATFSSIRDRVGEVADISQTECKAASDPSANFYAISCMYRVEKKTLHNTTSNLDDQADTRVDQLMGGTSS